MFSDEKRGGTAPTPTAATALFAGNPLDDDEVKRRPRTHDTSASDLVDLNLALRAEFRTKEQRRSPASFNPRPQFDREDEWAVFKPAQNDEARARTAATGTRAPRAVRPDDEDRPRAYSDHRGSPSKAFEEPRDLRKKSVRKKPPKSAPKYRAERRASPEKRAPPEKRNVPRSATARPGLFSTTAPRSSSARPGLAPRAAPKKESRATSMWRSKSARGERTKAQAALAYKPKAKGPKSASSTRRKPVSQKPLLERPRLTVRSRRDVADWERGVLRAPTSPVASATQFEDRKSLWAGVKEQQLDEETTPGRRYGLPPSRQKGAYPTHLETASTDVDDMSPPASPQKRPSTASRQRREDTNRPPSARQPRGRPPEAAPSSRLLDGVEAPSPKKVTSAWSDAPKPTPTLYSDDSSPEPLSKSRSHRNDEDRHHDPEADGFTAIDGPRTPCPFKIQVQHGVDAVELDDLGLSRNYDSGARSPVPVRPQSARNPRMIGSTSPKASWTQPPRRASVQLANDARPFFSRDSLERSQSTPDDITALLERTQVEDAELESISDEDILEVASDATDDDDDPHLETNLGEEFLSLFAGTPAG